MVLDCFQGTPDKILSVANVGFSHQCLLAVLYFQNGPVSHRQIKVKGDFLKTTLIFMQGRTQGGGWG